MTNFMNSFIPDRIRIIRKDKDPMHIYELLSRHTGKTLTELTNLYKVEVQVIRGEIKVSSTYDGISTLFDYLTNFKIDPLSITQTVLIFELDDFIRKIY